MTRRDHLLSLSAVAGALVLVAVVAGTLTHSRPVAFRSGSMSPTIPTGAVALVHTVPAAELRVGDVVTVSSGDSYVTHRIVQLTRSGERATLQLQGDANRVPDADLHEVSSAERVVASVPWLGYLLGGLSGPAGLLLLALYGGWLAQRLVGGRPPARPTHRATSPSRRHRRRAAVGTVALVAAAATTLAAAPRVWAAGWTDPATVSGTTLTAYTVPAPATFTCGAVSLANVTFNWTAVTGATSYTLHYGQNGASTTTVTGTTAQVAMIAGGGTAWVNANVSYGSTTWTSVNSATRTYQVIIVGTCS